MQERDALRRHVVTRAKRVLLVVAASAVLAGCAVFASKSEYQSYRQVRMAEERNAKLVAMQAYIAEHPEGTWSKTIQEERVRLEPEVWAESHASREGLEFYLQAFPDGPHAAEARPRLAALQTVQSGREEEAERAREIERQRREALEERRRTWLTRAMQFWTQTMIGVQNWGSPIADVARQNPPFNRAFGQAPRPRCSREECIKFYQAQYAIPVPGATRIDRSVELMLRLRMRNGNVQRAEMLLPNKGFSRWYEQENRTIVTDEDPTQRQQAIEWALERIVPAIRETAPNAQPIDVVPEPIDPPTVRAPNQPDPGASFAPGDTAEEREEAPPQEPQEPEAPQQRQQQGGGALDELLDRAAGTEEDQAAPTPEPEPEPAPEPESMVLPIALQGFRVGDVRIVIFAASTEDYGVAYDGVFIEHLEETTDAQPAQRPRRGGRRGVRR